jgi:N-methylhydantoinase B
MVITLIKTAYSSVIYDGEDCSCAVLDADGQLLTLDAGLPLHIVPMPFSVREVLRDFRGNIQPGDLFLVNSPYRGGTHLPDVLAMSPIFYQGRLAFFCAARGHWTDIGGAVPGSLSGKATEIHQEGVIIPPIKLYEAGRLNVGAFDLIVQNTRLAEERAGDLRAHVAACKTAERRLLELLDKYGLDVVLSACHEGLEASERYMRSVLRSLPAGTASYEDYLDSDGILDTPLRIKATVTIGQDELIVDFTGTAAQTRGPYNISFAGAQGAAVVASKILFDPYGPMNEGVFRPIKVIAPEGTILNARYPAPTGAFGEVSYRTIFTVIGALANVVPEHTSGADYGAVNHCYVTSSDQGRHSIFYAYPPGGNGGTWIGDGPSALRGPSSGDVALQALEMVEVLHPVLFRAMRLRADSGGPGKFRGGLGMSLELEVLSERGGLNIISDRTLFPPFGIFGGHPALPNEWKVISEGHEHGFPGGKAMNHPLSKGDTVVMHTGGAGGYGDPLDREPERVRQDVLEGLVTHSAAHDIYGVVLSPHTFQVDPTATEARRKHLRAQRKLLRPRQAEEPTFDGGVRVVFLSPGPDGAALPDGELVELVSTRLAAPVRFRLRHDPQVQPDEAVLDAEVWEMLGLQPGDRVELRSIAASSRR